MTITSKVSCFKPSDIIACLSWSLLPDFPHSCFRVLAQWPLYPCYHRQMTPSDRALHGRMTAKERSSSPEQPPDTTKTTTDQTRNERIMWMEERQWHSRGGGSLTQNICWALGSLTHTHTHTISLRILHRPPHTVTKYMTQLRQAERERAKRERREGERGEGERERGEGEGEREGEREREEREREREREERERERREREGEEGERRKDQTGEA